MRKFAMVSSVAAFAVLWSVEALAEVKVNFVEPEQYTDANLNREYGKRAKETTMREIERYLTRLGGTYLKPGETLPLTFSTSISRAGSNLGSSIFRMFASCATSHGPGSN